MPTTHSSAFALPVSLAAKSAPTLIAADETRFAAIGETLEQSIASLERRLEATRLLPGGHGEAAMERDLEVRRLASRLRTLRRFSLDLTLGRVVFDGSGDRQYIGRLGLTSVDGERLLVDWRAPAAEPFFAATRAQPSGLARRRRYRWIGGRVSDYWDEAFTEAGVEDAAALDDESTFIASLGASRSPQMRDVLSTIQADQDSIIRASARGALVVDGGPGTGKTVVALHRAAYLLYADPLLAPGRGGVLFIGPHEAYLSYVDDVLPSLGEDSVQIRTLRDLVREGSSAESESDAALAVLKGSSRWVDAIERAVRLYEEPPIEDFAVETPWADLVVSAEDWAEAFASAEHGATHNEARDQVWDTLLEILLDRHDRELPRPSVRRTLEQNAELAGMFARAWPLLDPAGLVASLWSTPAFLRRCAPWVTEDEAAALTGEWSLSRSKRLRWTTADLPLLDAARFRIGDPTASARRVEDAAVLAAQREQMEMVVDHLIAADDSELKLMSMLRVEDAQYSLVDESELEPVQLDALAGPFAHVIVDEAQELTDAEWQMLLRRCPSRSLTIVGDRAQARRGFAESWDDRLTRVGVRHVRVATLTVNYRTPEEVMREAEPVIRAAIPDANVPSSIRSSGVPVRYGAVAERDAIVGEWLASRPDGVACVIGDPTFEDVPRVRSLTPEGAKGLEFDLVVLVDPDAFGDEVAGAVDRYVAMTRATEQLVVLHPDR